MSVVENGFLGLSIDGTSPIVAIPVITVSSICVIIQIAIGMIACRQMAENDKVQTQFKVSFFGCLLCVFTAIIMNIAGNPMFWSSFDAKTFAIQYSVFMFTGLAMYLCLLIVLVQRLRVVFREFMQMSCGTYSCFICLLTLLFLIAAASSTVIVIGVDYSQDSFNWEDFPTWATHILGVLTLSFWILFVIGSILALSLFINKLRKLALSQISDILSAGNVSDLAEQGTLKTDDISLNDRQRVIIELATRYTLLFVIALATDFFIIILLANAVNPNSGLRQLFFAIDFTTNLLCVYLQFAFAGEQYTRCCGCAHRCWKKRVNKIAKGSIRRHSIQLSVSRSKHSIQMSTSTSFSTATSPSI